MKNVLAIAVIAVLLTVSSCNKNTPSEPGATATAAVGTATVTMTVTETATATATVVPELFFSEYVEGTSNNKALEIYNAGGAAADLAGVLIRIYANGASTVTSTISLNGTIDAGGVFVLANSQGTGVVSYADMTSTALTFNGNDAVVMIYGGETLDVIGQIGYNPGMNWGSGQEVTIDATLKRKCFVTSGDVDGTDAFNPADEWAGFPVDTFSGLGTYDCGPDLATATLTHTITPTDTATMTITETETVTPTVTATATSTAIPNYVLLDNFTDGNLQNTYGNNWSPRTPFADTWALLSIIGSGYNGNSLYVTCYAKASVGNPGAYFSIVGTSTYFANITPVNINPVNKFEFMGRFDVTTEPGAQGTYGFQVLFNTPTSSVSAYNTIPLAVTNGAWASYSVDLDSLTYFGGTKEQLFSAMGFIEITLRYTTPVQNEVMTAEILLDDVGFSE